MISKANITVQSPGRINLIGEHTDYNEGFVLPAAIDKKIKMQLHLNGKPHQVNVLAKNMDERDTFDLRTFEPLEGGWQNYVRGVINEFKQEGAEISGIDINFEGDIPLGGGMSSSAALECSLAFAINELFEIGYDRIKLIHLAQRAEHHFVGTKCGIMDQFASVMGKEDSAFLLDCRTLDYQYFPIQLKDHQLLLLNTNVSHNLASSEYNDRREQCEEAIAILNEQSRTPITHLRDVSPEYLKVNKHHLSEVLYNRCLHVVSENQRVLEATQALKNNNLEALGQLMYASHSSLDQLYEVSCPELNFLVEQSRGRTVVKGSRMMGGGFGGCTINLIEKSGVEQFVEEVRAAYFQKFGIDLSPYEIAISKGTSEI